MQNLNTNFLQFQNILNTKLPSDLDARFCFQSEMVKIPNTEVFLEVPENTWIAYDEKEDVLLTFTIDQFTNSFIPANKKSQKYFEFITDSLNNEYFPPNENVFDVLTDEVKEEFLEKEISLNLKGRLRLIWDLLLGKKINISKY